MDKMPHPVTTGDFYLQAILDELRELRAELKAARTPVVADALLVKEPEAPAKVEKAPTKEPTVEPSIGTLPNLGPYLKRGKK